MSWPELEAKTLEAIELLNSIMFGDVEDVVTSSNGIQKGSIDGRFDSLFSALRAMVAGSLAYKTKAEMDAAGYTTASLATVWDDPAPVNNGMYGWDTTTSSFKKSKYDIEHLLKQIPEEDDVFMSVGDDLRIAFGWKNDELFTPFGPFWDLFNKRLNYTDDDHLFSIGDKYRSAFAVANTPDLKLINPWINRVGESAFTTYAKPKLYIAGDSRADRASNDGRTTAADFLWWLEKFCAGRFDFDPSDNYGVAGDDSEEMLAAVTPLLAADPGVIIAICSTNDRTAGWSSERSQNALADWQAQVLERGHQIVWIAETPRGTTANPTYELSGSNLLNHLNMRQWFLDQSKKAGVYAVDVWPAISDVNSSDGHIISGIAYDELHFGPSGGYLVAEALAPTINMLFAPRSKLIANAADTYSISNQHGSINLNPMMTGVGGTLDASSSGDLANNWSSVCGNGLTATLSKTTIDAYDSQRLVVGGAPLDESLGTNPITPDPQSVMLVTELNPTKISVGDTIEASGLISVSSGASGIRAIAIYLTVTTASGTITHCSGEGSLARSTPNLYFPDVAFSGPSFVPALTITEPVISASLSLVVMGQPANGASAGSAMSATIDLTRISAKKVRQ